MKTFYAFLILSVFSTANAQFWSPTGALGTSGGNYLTVASSIGDNVYAVGNNAVFVYSSDRGVNWTAPTIASPPGVFASLTGCNNYLYASMKINTYDFELHYSLDNGTTWVRDTIGLPQNITNTGKTSMNVRYMGNNYVLAFNSGNACYKELGTSTWIPTQIDFVIVDVIGMNGDWFAIGAGKLLKSTNNGASWSQLTTTGLPNGFQGNNFASNGIDRLFVSNAPANGGEEIYLSTDNGDSWNASNSAGNYAHANPWIGKMHAVDDYIFASVTPEANNFTDAPPFLISSTSTPDYSVGDVSGLPIGQTNTALPFFFNSGNKLFTMFWDLYVSEPGFVGDPINGVITQDQIDVRIYPNPARDVLHISNTDNISYETIALYSIQGELVKTIDTKEKSIIVSELPRGCYFLKLQNTDNLITKKIVLK